MAMLFSSPSREDAHNYQASVVGEYPLAEVRHIDNSWQVHDMSEQIASLVDIVASVVVERVLQRLGGN